MIVGLLLLLACAAYMQTAADTAADRLTVMYPHYTQAERIQPADAGPPAVQRFGYQFGGRQ